MLEHIFHIAWHTVARIFAKILDGILPKNKLAQELEMMTPASFSSMVRRVQEELPRDVYSLFKYKDSFMRKALWELKYKGNPKVAKLFAQLLYEEMQEIVAEEELFTNFTKPLIIPIPLSKTRFKERGWNQADMIAKALVQLNPYWQHAPHILQKIRHTKPQTRLHRSQRLENLRGCFAVSSSAHIRDMIRNKNIILIDDVTTTGSTIIEARRTLLEAGARRVLAFTVAH